MVSYDILYDFFVEESSVIDYTDVGSLIWSKKKCEPR